MTRKIAINGYGRIGRLVHRIASTRMISMSLPSMHLFPAIISIPPEILLHSWSF